MSPAPRMSDTTRGRWWPAAKSQAPPHVARSRPAAVRRGGSCRRWEARARSSGRLRYRNPLADLLVGQHPAVLQPDLPPRLARDVGVVRDEHDGDLVLAVEPRQEIHQLLRG